MSVPRHNPASVPAAGAGYRRPALAVPSFSRHDFAAGARSGRRTGARNGPERASWRGGVWTQPARRRSRGVGVAEEDVAFGAARASEPSGTARASWRGGVWTQPARRRSRGFGVAEEDVAFGAARASES